MKCYYCKGDMKAGLVTYTINRSGYRLLVDDVEAWVCTRCGEPFFEGRTVDAIQEVILTVERPIQRVKSVAVG